MNVTAELPGLEDKDIDVELTDGLLAIRGQKKTETEDQDRLFSERFYGRFERRIPGRPGVLTITLPKSPDAQQKVKRIPVNGK